MIPRTLAGLLAVLLLAAPAPGAGDVPPRARPTALKAAYLYNLANFTRWPSPTGQEDPLVIGILGPDPFGSDIDALADQKVADRPLSIRRLGTFSSTTACHILYISPGLGEDRIRVLLTQVSREGLLTVGENETFARMGGVVQFQPEGQRIRLLVNLRSAKRWRLEISARLLQLARILDE